MFQRTSACLLTVACLACSVVGCGDSSQSTPAKVSGDPPPLLEGGHGAGHDHDRHGPHDGELFELGKGKFHLELVHDDATETVTVYILDTAAKDALPITAEDVHLNLVMEGKPRQFALAPAAQSSDPEGKSSCFRLTDKELCEGLDAKGTTGRIAVTIDDKPYSAPLRASHDHAQDHKH